MVNSGEDVQVPMCGASADLNEEWNTGAKELRERGVEPLLTACQELAGSYKAGSELAAACTESPSFPLTPCAGNYLTVFVPPELESMQHELRRFVEAMVFKLRKNAHKGKWEDFKLEEAFRRMRDEIIELEQAAHERNSVEILMEASDVANFAMIIASIATEKGV